MKQASNRFASLSLVSTIVTAVLTSIHHAYEIGFAAVILVVLFVVAPIVLMRGFKNNGTKEFLWAYGLLNTWLVVGLGLVDGLGNHIIKPVGFLFQRLAAFHGGSTRVVEKAVEGGLIYESAGMLTFVASMFAAYYGYKFIWASRQSEATDVQNNEG